MWFCFLTPEKCKRIYEQWCAVYETESGGMTHFTPVDEKECHLLQNIFNYFASRTVSTSKKPTCKRYQLLVKHKIDHFFTRAMVYPLYPSHTMMGLGKLGLPNLLISCWILFFMAQLLPASLCLIRTNVASVANILKI